MRPLPFPLRLPHTALVFGLAACLGACDSSPDAFQRGQPSDADPASIDEGSGDELLAWDASPPAELAVGWELDGRITCGLFGQDFETAWVFDGSDWGQLWTDGSLRPLDGLEVCLRGSEKRLSWRPDGAMHLLAGDLDHFLEPTLTEDRWLGKVEPVGGSTSECDAALAEYGLSWPVTMTLDVAAVVPPAT